MRTNESGRVKWQTSLGGSNYELGYGVTVTDKNEIVVIGGSPSLDGQVVGNHGNWDVWLVALSLEGNPLWASSLGGSEYDAGYAVVLDHDGGLVLIGETYSNDGDVSGLHGDDEDVWLVKLRR